MILPTDDIPEDEEKRIENLKKDLEKIEPSKEDYKEIKHYFLVTFFPDNPKAIETP